MSDSPSPDDRPILNVLFLSWDGAAQSYFESLFLPLLGRLQERHICVHALQITWAGREQIARTRQAAVSAGVHYHPLAVPERFRKVAFPALLALGLRRMASICRKHAIDVLMPRSIVPAALALMALRSEPGLALLYEGDGLMADERVDFAGWAPGGLRYLALQCVETAAVRRAGAVTVRTRRARDILLERAGAEVDREKVFVIPNAKDAALFHARDVQQCGAFRRTVGIPETAPWLLYVGSIGPQYHVHDMLRLFEKVRRLRPDARFHILTWQLAELERIRETHQPGVVATSAKPAEMVDWISAADVGLAFRAATFSQQAVCPIKVAEYLSGGLPVIASPIGDLREQLGGVEAAFLLESFSDAALDAAARWFVHDLMPRRAEARPLSLATGRTAFSFQASIDGYERAVRRAAAARGTPHCRAPALTSPARGERRI